MKKEWGELMFKLVSDYKPTGDQPKAIEYLSKKSCKVFLYKILLKK